MKLRVLLNRSAGTFRAMEVDDAVRAVEARLGAGGHEVTVAPLAPEQIEQAIRDALAEPDLDGIVIGGGDGTVSTAARLMAGDDKALGVLPLGTMNLVARDLGLPLEIEAALDALAGGEMRPVDMGRVNDLLFVNHASIGLHPWMVEHRERQRSRIGRGKWWAMIRAWMRMFRRHRTMSVRLALPDGARWHRTAVVIVANNRFSDEGAVPTRAVLDRGLLAVYVAHRTGRLGLIRLVFASLRGHWNDNALMDVFEVPGLAIASRRKRVRMSVDGEIELMIPPLRFRSLPKTLRVIVPRRDEEGDREEASTDAALAASVEEGRI